MKKHEINIIYGKNSLEELLIKTITKELLSIVESNNYYEYGK